MSGVKKFKPSTPSLRQMAVLANDVITKGVKPLKSLLAKKDAGPGRNNHGRITTRHKVGGVKQKYRIIDFKRNKLEVPATVKTIEYDPNRSARIALLFYADGEKRYILAPNGLKVGQKIVAGPGVPPEVGNSLPLAKIPVGTLVHNVELHPGKGGQIIRSAGTYAQLLAREGKYATLKMPSGEMRKVLSACMATVGVVSNPDHMNERKGKAGRNRWLGVRPRVRGVVMNPVDHPMGGGEGRSSGGHPRSRKGLLAKGYKTRNKKKASDRYIIERRKK
jgi:large subunit ribosomal protein L2